MDSLCLKAGIHAVPPPPITVSGGGCLDVRATHASQICANAVGRSSVEISPSASSQQRSLPWGFSFRHPLRSLWPTPGKNTYDAAMAVNDAVLVDEKDDKKEEIDGSENEGPNGSWVLKILHVRSLWKQERQEEEEEEDVRMRANLEEEKLENGASDGDDKGGVCTVCDDDDDENIDFDRDSFTKLLRRVSLAEARLYAQMSYLGSLAYSIPQIKVLI